MGKMAVWMYIVQDTKAVLHACAAHVLNILKDVIVHKLTS